MRRPINRVDALRRNTITLSGKQRPAATLKRNRQSPRTGPDTGRASDRLAPHRRRPVRDRSGSRPGLGLARRLTCWLAPLAVLLLGACATPVFNRATNGPLAESSAADMGRPQDIVGRNVIALSFSGGGLRAAAFAQGVLQGLAAQRTPEGDLLDDVTFVSSVSGGSLTAAHFGLHGRAGLARFRDDVLLRDYEASMRTSIVHPDNLWRILRGGLNDHSNFAAVLDREVFQGAVFGDLYRQRRPDIRINATDLYHRVPFLFVPVVFAALCSDLREYKLADAVAASMAVPLLFAPVVVRSWPERCTMPQSPWVAATLAAPSSLLAQATAEALAGYRAGGQPHYVKLVDGGVSDNYGLSGVLDWRLDVSSPLGLLTAKDAVTMERMLLLLVDAGRSRSGDWSAREEGPAGVELALSVANAGVDSAARLSADFFSIMLDQWQRSIVEFRCSLSEAEVRQLRGSIDGWNCRDVRFERDMVSVAALDPDRRRRFDAIPTRLTLSAEQVDEAIEAGRRGLLATEAVRIFSEARR